MILLQGWDNEHRNKSRNSFNSNLIRDVLEDNVIMAKTKENKPVIETLINTSALALTSTGVVWTVNGFTKGGLGLVLILFGAGLEFFKYWGRKNHYW